MLVLSRKQKEQIKIGDGITITVLEVRGNVVKIGIQAPHEVRVLRGELNTWDAQPAPLPRRPRRSAMALAS